MLGNLHAPPNAENERLRNRKKSVEEVRERMPHLLPNLAKHQTQVLGKNMGRQPFLRTAGAPLYLHKHSITRQLSPLSEESLGCSNKNINLASLLAFRNEHQLENRLKAKTNKVRKKSCSYFR